MKKRVLLAFSGGLDTSAILVWLNKELDQDVIAYCCNVGNQPQEEILRQQAKDLGATDFIFEDQQAEFTKRFVLPSLAAGATYFDDYLLGTALARPLIAERMNSWANHLNIDTLVHGGTGKGNDHIRFERAWAFLAPTKEVIAPWKLWQFKGRSELIDYLKRYQVDWKTQQAPLSIDLNLMHRSCEGGDLEDPALSYSTTEVFERSNLQPKLTTTPFKLEFAAGIPIKLNDRIMKPEDLISSLNQMGSDHCLGIVDLIEERISGMKSRGIYESPGAMLLFQCYKELRRLCCSKELYFLAQRNGDDLGQLIYQGLWFSDARRALSDFFEPLIQTLNGTLEGIIVGNNIYWHTRQSPNSLYNTALSSFEQDIEQMNKASLGYTQFLTAPLKQQGIQVSRIDDGSKTFNP